LQLRLPGEREWNDEVTLTTTSNGIVDAVTESSKNGKASRSLIQFPCNTNIKRQYMGERRNKVGNMKVTPSRYIGTL
jgi:hypothetical protein